MLGTVNVKTYEADLKATKDMLDALCQKRDHIEGEIALLKKRETALETLVQENYPHKGQRVIDQNTSEMSALINVIQPRITDVVKGILMASKEPLTSSEIYEKLPQFGWTIEAKNNPWALIHGIGHRLVAQKFAKEVYKDNRKAWIRAK
jgi:hypothetical protein